MNYSEFKEDWNIKAANIEADLEYRRKLTEHFVTVQLTILKLNELMQVAEWMREQELTRWYLLGYEIFALNNRLLNLIPDFSSRLVPQFNALSTGTIKEDMLFNVTLGHQKDSSKENYLAELRQRENIKEAFITEDKTLVVVLINPQHQTIQMIGTVFGRDIESKGLNLNRIRFFDAASSKIAIDGNAIFEKPLNY